LELQKVKDRKKEKLPTEELRNMYPSPNIVRTKKRNERRRKCKTHGIEETIVR
jgi:uncharacterized protein Veg